VLAVVASVVQLGVLVRVLAVVASVVQLGVLCLHVEDLMEEGHVRRAAHRPLVDEIQRI
jgi:hypothetical protein